MPTFEGFTGPKIDVLQFLQEIDLFLWTLLRAMRITANEDWHKDCGVPAKCIPNKFHLLEDIMTGAAVAQKTNKLGEYFEQLANQVHSALTKQSSITSA